MPAYVVVQVSVDDADTYEEYKRLAPPSIAEYGGRYIVRGPKVDVLEGDWQPGRFVMLEFPGVAEARAWWESDSYAAAKAMRQRSATTQMILVEGT